jgi:ATP-binding cassette subfamily C protein
MTRADSKKNGMREVIAACRDIIVWALIFGAGVNLLYLAPSLFMMQIFDRVLPSGGLYTLVFISLALLLALGTLAFLDTLRTRLSGRMSLRLDRRLSPLLLDLSMRPDAKRTSRRAVALREFDTLRNTLTGPGANAVMDAPWAPIYVLVCFLLHPAIGVLTLAGGIILILLAIANERTLRKSLAKAGDMAPRLYQAQDADAAAAEAVGALGMRGALVARQLARRAELNAVQAGALLGSSVYAGATKFLRLALQSAALGVGAWLAVERQISPGALIAASILASRALAPLDQIVGAWRPLAQGWAAYKLVRDVVGEADERPPETTLPEPKGALRFERVSIRVPESDRLALSDVSFQVAPGEVLGVIGPSGAGKSTLARAAAGAIRPDVGVVRLDGANLSDWEPDALGRHIGYLPQDIGLLSGTVAENIRRFLPRDEAIDALVIDAAKRAGAHELILRLPKGYEAPIALGGRGLSFGQAQRVALARALFRAPALIVLDEPNAHLDGEGEAALARAVRETKERGAVVIIVAHRAGVLALADRIMALRDGKIEWIEPREEVMRRMTAAAEGGNLAPIRARET